MQVQPGGDLSQNLAQAGLVGWRQVILRPGVPVVRKCDDLRMMRRVVVAEDTLSSLQVCICGADAHQVTQLGADHFVEVEKRVIPKEDTTPDETVEVVRGQACERLLQVTYQRVPAQAPFQRCKAVVDPHAATNSLCMNWRTGNDVR